MSVTRLYLLLLLAWGCSDAAGQQLVGHVPRAAPSGTAIAVAIDTTANRNTADVTSTNFGGGTPTAVCFLSGKGTSIATELPNVGNSFGCATTSTEEAAAGIRVRDATVSAQGDKWGVADGTIIQVGAAATPALQSEADFTSFSANTATLNWSNEFGTWSSIGVMLGATDAEAGTFDPNDTQDATTAVTSPGFQADAVILYTHCESFGDAASTDACLSIGFYDGTNNVSAGIFVADGSNPLSAATHVLSNRAASGLTSISAYSSVQLSTNASGFTATTRDANAATGLRYGYLAMDAPGGTFAGTFLTPTSTGTQAYTGVGFQPAVVFTSCALVTSADALDATDAGAMGYSVFTANSEHAVGLQVDDGTGANTDTASWWWTDAVGIPADAPTTGQLVNGSLSSMDSDGFTINYTAVDAGNQYYCAFLALE